MYLTATALKTYLSCPYKFYLSHIKKLRRKVPKASIAFGTTIHASIEKFFIEGISPETTFRNIWQAEQETEYEYSNGDTHTILLKMGEEILKKWKNHPDTPREYISVEEQRYIEIEGKVPFWSTIDFVGKDMLLDWKTANARYSEHKVKLDLQLTAYAYVLAETEKTPERVGFGVFIKKKSPEIQYLFATRTVEDLENFKKIVLKVWKDIEEEHFYKNPGVSCAWCDYLPICIGEDADVEEKFIVVSDRYSDKHIEE
ncbi:RecB family exonuclease [Thermodesulfovibrio sp. TK110]